MINTASLGKDSGLLERPRRRPGEQGARMNILILRLPKGVEGNNPTCFFESWLMDVLHIETKSGRIKLERAHRSLAPKSPSMQRPRPGLVCFHNYQDKQRAMNMSCELGRKKSSGETWGFYGNVFPRFIYHCSPHEEGLCEKMAQVSRRQYRQIYPALLKVPFCGSSKVFNGPMEAEHYVDSLEETPLASE